MSDVLALSYGYTPVARISWKDAICDVLSGRAEVLETYANRSIRTVKEIFPMPSVIRFIHKMTGYIFRKRAIKFNRKNIWLRDNGACQYCGHKVSMSEFTYDHVTPLSQGGKTVWENIVVACLPCNQRKACRTPTQARMRLVTTPGKPKSLSSNELPFSLADMPDSWKDYIGSLHYWHDSMQ